MTNSTDIFDNIKCLLNESSKVHCIFKYRNEIGLGLFKPANLFLSGMILDLFFQSKSDQFISIRFMVL